MMNFDQNGGYMCFRKIVLVILALGFLTGQLSAQLGEVADREDFSTESVEFDFEGPKSGSLAGDVLSRWGLNFLKGSVGVPTIMTRFELVFSNNLLHNGDGTGQSAEIPLVINLKHPALKVGFEMSNGDENTQVTVTAFDELGNKLGSVQRSGLEEPAFLGVGVGESLGISKVVLSYGADEKSEEIDDLIVEYVDRPEFASYLAQIADGPIPGFGTFQTTIIVTNVSNSTASGELAFFDGSGDPLALDFGDGEKSTLDLMIRPSSSVTFVSSGTASPVGVGYARILSSVPVDGTAVFRLTRPNGEIASEAGVGSDRGRVDAVGAVEKLVAENFDSGIAAVNISDSEASAEIQLYDQSGEAVDLNKSLLELPPGGHTSGFLSSIFPDLQSEDFSGTIRVVSDVPLAVVIMRTANGVVISSLPVGSLQK
jgi:hypothetical protein